MPLGTIQYGDLLEKLVNRVLAESEQTMTFFRSNIYWDRLSQKKNKVLTGAFVEFPIATGRTGTAKNFTVYGASDSAVYNPVDKTEMVQLDWKLSADFIRLSNIKARMASGPEALLSYFRTQADIVLESLKELISDNLFNGNGQNENPWGLDALLRINGPSTSPQDYALGNVRRVGKTALQAKVRDARDTVVITAPTYGITFTNGSDLITGGAGAAFTTDFRVGGSLTAPDGRVYTIAYIVDNTNAYLERAYEGATAAGSTSWSYRGAYSNTTVYGASGQFTPEKLNKIIALCTDGVDHPTDIIVNSEVFDRFLNVITANSRFTGYDNERIGAEDILVLKYNGANIYIDNHAPVNKVYVLNQKYGRLVHLKGYEKPQLSEAGLRWDVTGTRIESLVGDVVCAYVHYIRALNRCGVLQGFQL